MIRFYLLPIERNALGNARGPKYFSWKYDPDPPGFNDIWSMKDYGSIDMAVLATDISQINHDNLIVNSDVYSFPEFLDDAMTNSDRGALLDYCELYLIPADWIYAGITFREAIRIVTSMMLFNQRVSAIMGYPSDPFSGITLNTQYQNLPIALHDALYQATIEPLHDALYQATIELGYIWGSRDQDQLRKIYKEMGDQWGSKSIYFGFTTL